MRSILSPSCSRRIYARRAVLSGLLLVAALMIHIISLEHGENFSSWLAAPAAIFAVAFTPLMRDVAINEARLTAFAGLRCNVLAYPVVFLTAGGLAPTLFAISVTQFLRSNS
ncbi:hypothetical protein [Shinella sumterensis]|jgi:hypothetical protein|uniref:Uncharacterized protein n=1 Tax=Shinella sumterensis TaxID=1967501 RepID=A0AA50CU07_9HYPH|nr:hypothetical protein [Shinella sumterensis]MBP8938378.1 hypothetical protein [Agrobacterium sp.]WLS01362.1 hypothetical protein Q9313_28610 [Shinella sumterensis]